MNSGRGDNTDLFSGKSVNYAKSRPRYPEGIISVLENHASMTRDSVIADVGSGTGILASLFLENGNSVFSVEPNSDMREMAMKDLSRYPGFHPVNGTAENTEMENASVDLIVAAQAFHWFDREKAGTEFRRIIRPGGSVALIWNDRIAETEGMNHDYESICMRFSPAYHGSGSSAVGEQVISDFFHGNYSKFVLENTQELDLDGLMGRYFSASYAIGRDDPHYDMLVDSLEEAFEKNRDGNTVLLRYETRLYLGKP